MKTLIAYSSKYGATRDCAERMGNYLPGQVDLLNLDTGSDVDLDAYGQIAVGCSVYMGKPRKAARKFCEKNMTALMDKRFGLFVCCIQDLEKQVSQQMQLAYPKPLIDHAVVLGTLGGTVDFTRLRSLDRVIMSVVAGDLRKKTGNNVLSTISDERIIRFCDLLRTAPLKT